MTSTPIPVDFLEQLWLRKSIVAAGHTLLVYDYFLTFDDEVQFIWSAPWTVVKVVFLINRYANLAFQTFVRLEEAGLLADNSPLFCKHYDLLATFFVTLSGESTRILVLMRAWAIWGSRRHVAGILIVVCIAYIVILLATTIWRINSRNSDQFQYLSFTNVCVNIVSKYAWIIYVASLVLDTSVFTLTLRSLLNHSTTFRGLYPSPLLRLLLRDVSGFFLISVFNNAFIIVCWTAWANDPRSFLARGIGLPLLAVCGQRVVFNLRGSQARTYSTRDLSREVDRQMDVFRDAGVLGRRGEMGDISPCADQECEHDGDVADIVSA